MTTIPTTAKEWVRAATGPIRHRRRVEATKRLALALGYGMATNQVAGACALLLLDLAGVGGPNSTGHGLYPGAGGTARLLPGLGAGRWQARDGGAYRAAALTALGEISGGAANIILSPKGVTVGESEATWNALADSRMLAIYRDKGQVWARFGLTFDDAKDWGFGTTSFVTDWAVRVRERMETLGGLVLMALEGYQGDLAEPFSQVQIEGSFEEWTALAGWLEEEAAEEEVAEGSEKEVVEEEPLQDIPPRRQRHAAEFSEV